ncbi:MAG: hypothetical protein Q4F31_02775 [Eubacteriales bacterium]|nr:hypothetical protein [Eubacteriales bacterium]
MSFIDLLCCFFITPLKLCAEIIECAFDRIIPDLPQNNQLFFIIVFSFTGILFLWSVISTIKYLRTQKMPSPFSCFSGYLAPSAVLTLLFGAMIPGTVIASSAVEFQSTHYGPMMLVLSTFLSWAGVFIFYGGLLYLICGEKLKKILRCLSWILIGCAAVNYLLFRLGTALSPLLVYDDISEIGTTLSEKIINGAVTAAVCAVFLFLFIKKEDVCKGLCIVFSVSFFVFSVMNFFRISSNVKEETGRNAFSGYGDNYSDSSALDLLHLSRNGKNVVVFSLDRAISRFIPFCLEESPELEDSLSDFTWYPNTVSYGKYTIFATPAMFGGYDYTPFEFNKRSEESVVDKHNEAICALPVLFSENGYDVTVCDIPYANYRWIPDLSIYDEYGIRGYNTMEAQMYRSSEDWPVFVEANEETQIRNFVMYSAFRCSPYFCRGFLYNRGRYLKPGTVTTPSMELLESYSVMEQLPYITTITDNDNGCLFIINNDLAHTPSLMDSSDSYKASVLEEASEYANNIRLDSDGNLLEMNELQLRHYHVTMSALLRISEWTEYLKENDVYDNTRVIIVSDHGRALFDDMLLDNGTHIESMNSLLMFKDFTSEGTESSEISNDSEGLTVDHSFMTNADMPYLASKDLFTEPLNPFTGNAFLKNSGEALVNDSEFWEDQYYTLKQFDYHDSVWFKVKDNIFNKDNWTVTQN